MKIFDAVKFGAVGAGQTLNTHAFEAIAAACREAGGGVLRIPAGTFLTGTFGLFSGTTLELEKDARLLASPRLEDHVVGNASVGLLYAQDARDILITGEGTLDGNAPAFFDPDLLHGGGGEDFSGLDTWQKRHGLPYGTAETVHGPIASPGRPGNMLIFARCGNVRIENVRITGAAYWTLHCADCEDLAIENVRVENDPRHPNNDGMHFTTCRRVSIRGCRIDAGDDAIAVTGFRDAAHEKEIAFGLRGTAGVCEDIDIADCVLSSRSSAVRIGYGQNPVRRVSLRGLDIHDSNRGICIHARQADVENVTVENCRIRTRLFHGNWWGRGEPIHVSAVRFPGEERLYAVRGLRFRDIDAEGENAVTFYAEESGAIDDVELTWVGAMLRRGELFETWGGNLDLRPTADAARSIIAGGAAPLWAMGVTHLRCEGCRWTLDENAGADFAAEPVIRETP